MTFKQHSCLKKMIKTTFPNETQSSLRLALIPVLIRLPFLTGYDPCLSYNKATYHLLLSFFLKMFKERADI